MGLVLTQRTQTSPLSHMGGRNSRLSKNQCLEALININSINTEKSARDSESAPGEVASASEVHYENPKKTPKTLSNKRKGALDRSAMAARRSEGLAVTFDLAKHLARELHNTSQQGSPALQQAPSSQPRGPWEPEEREEGTGRNSKAWFMKTLMRPFFFFSSSCFPGGGKQRWTLWGNV